MQRLTQKLISKGTHTYAKMKSCKKYNLTFSFALYIHCHSVLHCKYYNSKYHETRLTFSLDERSGWKKCVSEYSFFKRKHTHTHTHTLQEKNRKIESGVTLRLITEIKYTITFPRFTTSILIKQNKENQGKIRLAPISGKPENPSQVLIFLSHWNSSLSFQKGLTVRRPVYEMGTT